MDNQPNQIPKENSQAIVFKKRTFPFPFILIVLIIVACLVALNVLFFYNQSPSAKKTTVALSPTPKPAADNTKLPISLSLLKNPIVYEWRGSVKGKIVKKDKHTFTLADDKGNSITISDIMPSGDIFKTMFYLHGNGNTLISASLSAIPLNSVLRGSFFIFKYGPNSPVGSDFIIQK